MEFTRKEMKELLIDMLAVAAVARKRGDFTDAECEAMKPEIQRRATLIHTGVETAPAIFPFTRFDT